ncbi:DUF4129 domain-containing protein [Halorhabdus amylolytica]|uniref:DUF4129 domain-containing protein n=1 Tax=Halorhabdus amylolytica TaxID=2559573 RepID=UPI0020BE29E4|nr:DUF4129 domain-containing protein [Halorhabdus amylolytica]
MQVDRRTAGVLVVGVLAALALTFAAATLTNPAASSGVIGVEDDTSGLFGMAEIQEPPGGQLPEFVITALTVVFVVVMIAGIVAGAILLDVRDLARIVGISLLGAVLAQLLLGPVSFPSNSSGGFGAVGSNGSFGPSGGGVPAAGDGSVSPMLLSGLGVVVLLALIALFALSTDEDTPEQAPEPEASDTEELASVGQAAGRAADDIEDSDVSTANAVYRAWIEMTDALEVSKRESTTPGEFAELAIEAGMAPDDVRELTRLFEDVRYGDEPVSETRAERARDALRRIESAYAGESR